MEVSTTPFQVTTKVWFNGGNAVSNPLTFTADVAILIILCQEKIRAGIIYCDKIAKKQGYEMG